MNKKTYFLCIPTFVAKKEICVFLFTYFPCIPIFKKIVSFYSHIFKICNCKKGTMRHIPIIPILGVFYNEKHYRKNKMAL